jgi:hypothetical protein
LSSIGVDKRGRSNLRKCIEVIDILVPYISASALEPLVALNSGSAGIRSTVGEAAALPAVVLTPAPLGFSRSLPVRFLHGHAPRGLARRALPDGPPIGPGRAAKRRINEQQMPRRHVIG